MERIIRLIPGYDPFRDAGDCRFDAKVAQRACDFFPKCLTHVKGELAGKPFEMEDWQKAIIANAFGWKRADGTRRYREVFIMVPRKNGKTSLAAGITCLVAFCDGEPGAEMYSAAGDRHQASLVRNIVTRMIRNEPELAKRSTTYQHSITFAENDGSYESISAEAGTKHGFNTHLAIIDELHVQPDRELVDALTTSTGARRQPLIVYITTSDYERPSICNEIQQYAEWVRDGIVENPAFLPIIHAADIDDDWKDPKIWAKANPNLDISISEEFLAAECKRAQESPAFENTFKRLHLNIKTEQERRWIVMAEWDACSDKIDPDRLVGRACWAGVDLASKIDLTSMVFSFPPDADDPLWRFVAEFWIPAEYSRKREPRIREHLLNWARQGYLHMTPGNVTDYNAIRDCLNERREIYSIQQIGLDPYNASQFGQQLIADGWEPERVIEVRQGISLSEACKEMERLIKSRAMAHGGHPVLRWNASNVTVWVDRHENIWPDKMKSSEKIDGISALATGMRLALTGESVEDASGGTDLLFL